MTVNVSVEQLDQQLNEAWASGKPEQIVSLLSWQFLAGVVRKDFGDTLTKGEFLEFVRQQGVVSGPFDLLHTEPGTDFTLTIWAVPGKQDDDRWRMERTYAKGEEGWQITSVRMYITASVED